MLCAVAASTRERRWISVSDNPEKSVQCHQWNIFFCHWENKQIDYQAFALGVYLCGKAAQVEIRLTMVMLYITQTSPLPPFSLHYSDNIQDKLTQGFKASLTVMSKSDVVFYMREKHLCLFSLLIHLRIMSINKTQKISISFKCLCLSMSPNSKGKKQEKSHLKTI